MSAFAEVFDFVDSEREDIRKMALQGLAAQSKDSTELQEFLVDPANGSAIEKLLANVQAKRASTLGDVLTTLINVCTDAKVVEAVVGKTIVERLLRLLDGVEMLDNIQPQVKLAFKELSLMLLNNLTATHTSAIAQLLQTEDEDLRGFYLGKLKTHYDREDEDAPRNLRKWYLQVCVNVSRSRDGMLLLAEDDEWLPTLVEVCDEESTSIQRALAYQIFRNMSNNVDVHKELLEASIVSCCLRNIQRNEEADHREVQLHICEILASMLQSEQGMMAVEALNIKKELQDLISKLPEGTGKFIEEHIIPFLDDVKDAYVVQGTTQDDVD